MQRKTLGLRALSTAATFALFFALFWSLSAGTANAQLGQVQLNEVQSSNQSTLQDASGTTPDWIELHNTSDATVDLGGWSLSDNPGQPQKWVVPSGTTIAPNGFLVVFASGTGASQNGELHAGFKLAASGEFLGLYSPAGALVSSFDPIPALAADTSWGVNLSLIHI